MTLADRVYQLRNKRGWTQEELASEIRVTREEIVSWEAGESIPDLEKIVEISNLFNVPTDYLLKGEESVTFAEASRDSLPVYNVSEEDAHDFIKTTIRESKKIAFGVSLTILSATPLLLLLGLAEQPGSIWTEDGAGSAGVIIILLVVAIAVVFFILAGMKLGKYDYLRKGALTMEPKLRTAIQKEKADYQPTFAKLIALGVAMTIVSPIALIYVGATSANERYLFLTIVLLLVMIALAVHFFIHAGMRQSAYEVLLEEGEYIRTEKDFNKRYDSISGVYWLLIVLIYLTWSFITFDWHITWIIWPIAGVLYGLLAAIIKAFNRR